MNGTIKTPTQRITKTPIKGDNKNKTKDQKSKQWKEKEKQNGGAAPKKKMTAPQQYSQKEWPKKRGNKD